MLNRRPLRAKNSPASTRKSVASAPSSRRKAALEITGWVALPAPKSRPGPASIAAPGSSSKKRRELSRRLRWARSSPLSAKFDSAVIGNRPMRVVGDLSGVAVWVEEERAVAAPERLGRLAADRRAGGARLLGHGVDLGRRAEVERQRDAAPAAAVLDATVLGEPSPVP